MKPLLLFATGLVLCHLCAGQNKQQGDSSARFSYPNIQDFITRVTTAPFPPLGKWKDINGAEFDFNAIHSPTVIRFGFRGCMPCKFEMNTFLKLSQLYKDVDFVYISYDSEKELLEDLKSYSLTGRMRFFSIPQTYINAYRLTFGYPATYFIKGENDVLHFVGGGRTSNEPEVYEGYRHLVDSIFTR